MVSQRRREGLLPLMDAIYRAVHEIVTASGGELESVSRTRGVVAAKSPWGVTLEFIAQTATSRTDRDGDLRIAVWRGSLREMPGTHPVFDRWFSLAILPTGEFGWQELRKTAAPVMTHVAMADWAVKRLLDVVERERRRS